ncbi:Short-chain dehydrogenase reductase family [Mycena sanguinolenta]|uniref:Short-chain dehydrogenase reductase family n=1 Tax=Mycena sanguinolenta TaxID=230812 RepID=A0A8H6Z5Q2_9AGAR|nr:Short-chain dehydrogenase reductase family [Mycena sanguinolenta]
MRLKYNPATDIPDLTGKVILVTGGTAGIGKEAILVFAKHNPQRLYFSGRNAEQAAQIIAEIKSTSPSVDVVFLECDLTSLPSVEKAAKLVVSQTDRLDILICNAGVMNVPPALTKEGYEVHFGINHVSHALFIKLLLPTLLRTAEVPGSDVRIVSLTSRGFTMHPSGGIVFSDLRTTQGSGLVKTFRYGQSKLANILYASELARRYPPDHLCLHSPRRRSNKPAQYTDRLRPSIIVDERGIVSAHSRTGRLQFVVGCYSRQNEDREWRVLRACWNPPEAMRANRGTRSWRNSCGNGPRKSWSAIIFEHF